MEPYEQINLTYREIELLITALGVTDLYFQLTAEERRLFNKLIILLDKDRSDA